MPSDFSSNSAAQSSATDRIRSGQPRTVLSESDTPHSPKILAFPPNRDTLGGTAYLIVGEATILVDCPAWDDAMQSFLQEQGGVDWLFLTHRGGIGKVGAIQQAFNCRVVIQEQEAYLLPGVPVTPFEQTFTLTPDCEAIWTPGHSPGSSCLYYSGFGGVLFSGRHLLPDPQGHLVPIKTAKTFHWPRQLRSLERLRDRFTPETLHWICPGANTGFLRGQYAVANAYQQLTQKAEQSLI